MKKAICPLFALLGSLAVAGCSVKNADVPNDPPKIEKPQLKAMKFDVEYGVMKPEVISVLLWPNDWDEATTEANVYTINKNSRTFDELIVEKISIPFKIGALYQQFMAEECIGKFRAPPAEGEAQKSPQDYQETDEVSWMALAPAAPGDAAYPEYEAKLKALMACQQNQAVRQQLHKRDNEIYSGDPVDHRDVPTVSKAIDNAIGLENKTYVSTEGSLLKIMPDGKGGRTVEIAFRDFNWVEGEKHYTQKSMSADDVTKKADAKAALIRLRKLTETLSGDERARNLKEIAANVKVLQNYAKYIQEVSLDVDGRRLQFTVPDMKSALVETSTASGPEFVYLTKYAFDLYRVDNLMSLPPMPQEDGTTIITDIAKFKGDIVLYKSDVDVRKGSGQLMGPFSGMKP